MLRLVSRLRQGSAVAGRWARSASWRMPLHGGANSATKGGEKCGLPASDGNILTYVCLDCGYTELYVEREYLNEIKSKKGD